ncbi:restriction endonuclease subunit S [Paenibacillus enshidis]|uniref:Restriction endonuclease subunit S n=1 Tax=Paenibacillus enshidis TaxID=1458439 RepID=A0ABV5AUP4_9BACL
MNFNNLCDLGMATISQDFLRKIPILLPPLEEQNEIMAILERVFEKEKIVVTNLVSEAENLKQTFERNIEFTEIIGFYIRFKQ